MTGVLPDGGPLSWLDAPAEDRGIRFSKRNEWVFHPYAEVATTARSVAAGLKAHGVRTDDRVVIVLGGGPNFVTAFFGALAAGATVTPVAPAAAWHGKKEYHAHLAGISRVVAPRVLVTDSRNRDEFAEAFGGAVTVLTVDELAGHEPLAESVSPAQLAVLQFTSGSSSTPRGVRIPYSALCANVHAFHTWLGITERKSFVQWMPFHHDMGLIGGLVSSVMAQCDLWNMRAGDFLRDPLGYLRCFDDGGAQVGSMANFGLAHIVNRLTPSQVANLDLSGCEAIAIGAERIDPVVLNRFVDLLGPAGLPATALKPGYGLAESTLVVTGAHGRPKVLELTADRDSGENANRPVVSCGRPVSGTTVSIVDEDGAPLPDGKVGEIVVRGPSLGAGYEGDFDASAVATTFTADGLHTGDAGFISDGELYPLGRMGDSIKVHGKAVFAEDLELLLAGLGVPSHTMAVLLGAVDGRDQAVVVIEATRDGLEPPQGLDEAIVAAIREATAGVAVEIVTGPFRLVERTTSGKPRRRSMWREYLTGSLGRAVQPT